ncbi:MAG: DUF362 domain-containing protein [Spirochaetes bacterium]|nr:DUF362 domain-containing protein [Spirochaetota bacterium]
MGLNKKTKVAIIKVDNHPDLVQAVEEALKLIHAETIIKPGETLLLKPNLLMKSVVACTQADFIEAVARALKPYKARMSLGDSPGQFGNRAKHIIRHLQLEKTMLEQNIAYAEFESEAVRVRNDNARLMKTYHMAKAVHDTDIIVNLPRPKSHIEASYTGAVKNLWGIIPGGEKAQCHLYGKDPMAFGNVIVDNYETMRNLGKKNIVIMDARTIMEGMAGPAAGPLRKTGLIIAGTDDAAVDMVMLAIGGRDGHRDVPHLRACRDRGIGPADLGSIEVVGETIESVRLKKKFGITGRGMMSLATFFTGTIIYKVVRRMPFLKKKECTQCGDCFKICPAQAITWEKKQYPKTDFNQCISCLCCVECCPQHAIQAKSIGVRGLFLKEPSITLPRTN